MVQVTAIATGFAQRKNKPSSLIGAATLSFKQNNTPHRL
jgi:hypothetical protein